MSRPESVGFASNPHHRISPIFCLEPTVKAKKKTKREWSEGEFVVGLFI